MDKSLLYKRSSPSSDIDGYCPIGAIATELVGKKCTKGRALPITGSIPQWRGPAVLFD